MRVSLGVSPAYIPKTHVVSIIEMSINNLFRIRQRPVQSPLDNVDIVLYSLVVDEFVLRIGQTLVPAVPTVPQWNWIK